MTELERRRVIVGQKLVMDRLGDLGTPVAERDTEQARRRVQHGTALMIDEIRALGFNDDAWVCFKVAVAGKRHPVLFKRVGREFHRSLPSTVAPGWPTESS